MSDAVERIGFPPPLLGEEPLRLAILHRSEGLLLLEKPLGLTTSRDPWYERSPNLTDAINHQVQGEKPELVRLKLGEVGAVINAAADEAGLGLLAEGEAAGNLWRNALGSGQFTFHYELLVQPTQPVQVGDEMTCDLPVARHVTRPLALVSHNSGKKAETHFRVVGRGGALVWVEASTTLPRLHLVRLHAQELGLPVLGDSLYGRLPPLYLSTLKPDYRPVRTRQEKALWSAPTVFLKAVGLNLPDKEPVRIEAPVPSRWSSLQRHVAENPLRTILRPARRGH